MSYSSSPYAPRARRDAVHRVISGGESRAAVARSIGVHRATIGKWIKKRHALFLDGREAIPTHPPVARHHPNQLPATVVAAIIRVREQTGRCAEVVQLELRDQGVDISLSSVKRTLRRQGLTHQPNTRKRHRQYIERPAVYAPGDLVEVDTVHFVRTNGTRFYVFTLIDLYSRAVYAEYSTSCDQRSSVAFLLRGQEYLGIKFCVVQTDNGSEFKQEFYDALAVRRIVLRHTRLGRPNDNAHIERFNRTIQEECLSPMTNETTIQERIMHYLTYYNWHRRHLGISGLTPGQMLPWR